MSIHEHVCRDAIKQLQISAAPLLEVEPVIELIINGFPGYYDEARRDSLVDLARHVSNKQRGRLMAAKELSRRSA
ncbi:hypothetical protein M1D96_06370 [Pseudomonas sp. D1-3]